MYIWCTGLHTEGLTPKSIIFNLIDHLELVDWTGRRLRENKVGSIRAQANPILQRSGVSPEHRVYLATRVARRFKELADSNHSLELTCQQPGCQ